MSATAKRRFTDETLGLIRMWRKVNPSHDVIWWKGKRPRKVRIRFRNL